MYSIPDFGQFSSEPHRPGDLGDVSVWLREVSSLTFTGLVGKLEAWFASTGENPGDYERGPVEWKVHPDGTASLVVEIRRTRGPLKAG